MPRAPLLRLELACGLLAAVTGWTALATVLLIVASTQPVTSGALTWSLVATALFGELAVSSAAHSRGGGRAWVVGLAGAWVLITALSFGGILISFAIFLTPAILLGLVALLAASAEVLSQRASS